MSRTPQRDRRNAPSQHAPGDHVQHEPPTRNGRSLSRGPRDRVGGDDAAGGVLSRVKDAVLHLLSHHERLFLVLWYAEKMTPGEIAMVLNLTEQQACETHGKLVGKLRMLAGA